MIGGAKPLSRRAVGRAGAILREAVGRRPPTENASSESRLSEYASRFLCQQGTTVTRKHLLPHAKRSAYFDRGNSDGIQRGNRSGSAHASDATGSNGPASAREECDGLRADTIDAATRHYRAAGHHGHRPASGAAQRQTGEIRRCALPTHGS